ncbi:MAG TPA: sulfatase, partial [Thermoanaerobaculia bacterium]|nr:sulfatase [Thermoanaerobaculia bacterium]
MIARTFAIALFAAAVGGVAVPGQTAGPPSIVLLTLDTTRADSLGCYGGKAASTPNLDALAARG